MRVGDTVRRPVGAWTPAVHALLRHLEEVGFEASPRVLGIDAKGREMLTFCEGVSLSLEAPQLLESLVTVAKAGALVVGLRTAVRSFVAPANAQWWRGSPDPIPGSLVIHGDLAPWNVIVNGEDWKLIDWDAAGPGRFEWEAAYTLHTFGQLWPESGLLDDEVVARIRAFGEGANLSSAALREVVELVPRRTLGIADMIERLAAKDHPAFTLLQQEGHALSWRAASDHVAARLSAWLRKLGGAT